MTGKQYQIEARRFAVTMDNTENLEHFFERPFTKEDGGDIYVSPGNLMLSALGIAGESGEVVDLVKKFVFHKKQVDVEHMKKELGDIMWYISLMCDELGLDLEDDVLQGNIDKLSARYPNGFNTYDANHRKAGDI